MKRGVKPRLILDRLYDRSFGEPGPLETPCLIFTGKHDKRGYGRISTDHDHCSELVHRVAWIERHGPIPSGTPVIMHRCDVPDCWADDHLLADTQTDNLADMRAKGRGSGPALKAECIRGHSFGDPQNVYLWRARRQCRKCKSITEANRREARQ